MSGGTAATLGDLLARQVREQPDGVAILGPGVALTYAELAAGVHDRERALRRAGVAPGRLAALLVDDVAEGIRLALGLVAAGAAFLWLDPDTPHARLRRLLQHARPGVLLAGGSSLDRHAGLLADPVCAMLEVGPDGIASTLAAGSPATGTTLAAGYVVHTSGSTGQPKAIVQTERNLVQFVRWFAARFGLCPGARILQWSTTSYDAAYAEVFGALAGGATLVVGPPALRADPQSLVTLLASHAVTHLQTVPSFCTELVDALAAGGAPAARERVRGTLRTVLLAGEVLRASLVERLRDVLDRPRIVNLYGPSEAILATWFDVPDSAADPVPIGRPVDGREVLVAAGDGRASAAGEPGELWVRSQHLASGYLDDPEATRAAFGGPPVPGIARTYRTGDVGVRGATGELYFLGRRDLQVKVRGHRVELGEVEAAVSAHPEVTDVAVVAVDAGGGELALVAHVVLAAGDATVDDELRAHAAERLPPHMVPHRWLRADGFPRTATGKVDRAALRARSLPGRAAPVPGSGPASLVEQVGALWAQALRAEAVGQDDDFFALGGDSLTAARMLNRVAATLGVQVPLPVLFDAPTLGAFVEELRRRAAAPAR